MNPKAAKKKKTDMSLDSEEEALVKPAQYEFNFLPKPKPVEKPIDKKPSKGKFSTKNIKMSVGNKPEVELV